MSNISRRDFMKTAGVMTLAVAASGVLAGCSTAEEDTTKKEVTATSVTIGDFTLSIADTKLYSVKDYNGTTDGSAKGEDQYLFVLGYLKNNADEAKDVKMYASVANAKNIDSEVTSSKVNKLFGVNEDVIINNGFDFMNYTVSGTTVTYKKLTNTTAAGIPFYIACKVAKTSYQDGTYAMKTPSANIAVFDSKEVAYAKLPITVPAATSITADDLDIS